jgi:hypothetical protein
MMEFILGIWTLCRSQTRLRGLICADACGREAVMVAGRVPIKIICLMVRLLAALAVLVFRKELAKEVELLVLRYENAVLRRHAGRIRYEPADRLWFTALTRLIPRRRWAEVFPVTPATLLGLAPQAGSEKVRHEQTAQPRPPARHAQHRPPCRPPGERESAVGLPPDPRRDPLGIGDRVG